MIVKAANIELSPESPRYEGGSWHVEGMQNEAIVATVIAYLHAENITESKLAFRYSLDECIEYEQGDDHGVEVLYGLEDGDPLNEHAGEVTCAAGRVICFPNTMQHRVQPFELADASKPGRRKIVVFFIVDPTKRITSTRTVPPQQLSWWRDVVRLDRKFPRDVVPYIEKHVEFPLSRAAAEEHRLELMQERSVAADAIDETYYEEEFSLCEREGCTVLIRVFA